MTVTTNGTTETPDQTEAQTGAQTGAQTEAPTGTDSGAAADVRRAVADFVVANYLFGDVARMPDDETSLVESGIVDSTGILELIEFLEEQFGIEVAESETVPSNLGSVGAITRFVLGKPRQTD